MWHRKAFWGAELGRIFCVVNQFEALISINCSRLKPLNPSLPQRSSSKASGVCLLKRAFQSLTYTEPHSDVLFKLLNLLSFRWINKSLKCNPFLPVRVLQVFFMGKKQNVICVSFGHFKHSGMWGAGSHVPLDVPGPVCAHALGLQWDFYPWLSMAVELPDELIKCVQTLWGELSGHTASAQALG